LLGSSLLRKKIRYPRDMSINFWPYSIYLHQEAAIYCTSARCEARTMLFM
jgi:hypothetical protein